VPVTQHAADHRVGDDPFVIQIEATVQGITLTRVAASASAVSTVASARRLAA